MTDMAPGDRRFTIQELFGLLKVLNVQVSQVPVLGDETESLTRKTKQERDRFPFIKLPPPLL